MEAEVSIAGRPPSPQRLRTIAAVVERGSFAAAGRELGISHTAVSQQVRAVEAIYGVRLFTRVGGVLRPTPAALELADIAERLRACERDTVRVLTRRNARGRPRLRLGLGNSMPGLRVVRRLLARVPDLSVEIESGAHQPILAAVLRRDLDAGVLPDIPADPRLRRQPILHQAVVAITSLRGPLADAEHVALAELANLPLVFRSRGSSTQRIVDQAFRRMGLAPEPQLVADTRDAVYEAVALGIGIGFIWEHGTARSDLVRRVSVPELSRVVEEVVFAPADERNELVDLLFAVSGDFVGGSAAKPMPER